MNNLPFERLLLGRKRLAQIIPRHDELFDDPEGVLSDGPIRIGPMRSGRFAFFLAVVVALSAFYFADQIERSRAWLSIAGGLLLAVAFSSLFHGIPIVLTRAGVMLVNGATVTRIPWSVLDAAGTPCVSQIDIVLPIAPGSADEIVMRRANGKRRVGTKVHTLYLTVRNDKLSLINRSEANSDDLVSLLVLLARSLGADPAAAAEPAIEEIVLRRDGDSVTLSARNLCFPNVCCRCLSATSDVVDFVARKRWEKILAIVTLFNYSPGQFNVSIPCCRRCAMKLNRRERRAALLGAGIGLIAGAACALPFWWDLDLIGRLGLSLTAAIIGPLIGYVVAELLAERRNSPVRSIRYDERDRIVTIRFRNEHYVDALTRRSRKSEIRSSSSEKESKPQ